MNPLQGGKGLPGGGGEVAAHLVRPLGEGDDLLGMHTGEIGEVDIV